MITIGPIDGIGTSWWFEIDDDIDQNAITDWLTKRITEFDSNYSRFKSDSYIGVLNETGAAKNPSVELQTLAKQAVYWFEVSEGLFNPFTARLQTERGYGAASQKDTDPAPDFQIDITPEQITLTGSQLDLGGFGKGWLIDSIAQSLQNDFGISHFLINGGGDIYATTQSGGTPFTIDVEHPTETGSYVAKVPLKHSAFAASSTYKRQWIHNESTHNHILDTTKQATASATPCASHVVATRAEVADVYATLSCIKPEVLRSDDITAFCVMPEGEAAYISETFRPWLLG